MPRQNMRDFTAEDFIREVVYDDDPHVRAIRYMEARGYLIDTDAASGREYISPDAHRNDIDAADRLLRGYRIGDVDKDGTIHITHPENSDRMEELFIGEHRVMACSCFIDHSLDYFFHSGPYYTIGIDLLEPFVARYIKSLLACSIDTEYACDGNHRGGHNMVQIGCAGECYKGYHMFICKTFLNERFGLRWDERCIALRFSRESKYGLYIRLNRAAEFLYKNKEWFRLLKKAMTREVWEIEECKKNREELCLFFKEVYSKKKGFLQETAEKAGIAPVFPQTVLSKGRTASNTPTV